MNKMKKIWLSISACLLGLGVIIFSVAMTSIGWDFTKLSTRRFETNEYKIGENFNDISIKTATADVVFALATDGQCKVQCYEYEKEKHAVSVQNSTLCINLVDEKSFLDNIGFNFTSPKITVYLPNAEYNALTIRASTSDIEIKKEISFNDIDIAVSTGDVYVKDIKVDALKISVSTGDIEVIDVFCKTFTSTGSTGDTYLRKVIVEGKMFIERSTGDIELNGCDAGEIFIETDTGDVEGTLLSEKVFVVKTDTGDKRVPNTTSGGRCEITTDTGDIYITIENP